MKVSMEGISVLLAMPVNRDLPAAVAMSLLRTQDLMRDHNIPMNIYMEVGGSLVHHSRTSLVHRFMQSDYTVLFQIDSDVIWEATDFLKFVALSTKMDVVCGSYPTKSLPPKFLLRTDKPGEAIESNEYGCLPIRGIGLGFTVCTRKVIEDLYNRAPKRIYPFSPDPVPRVFRCDEEGMEVRGEDMAFFADIRDLGYSVNLDPTVTLGHIGPHVYSASVAQFIEAQ